MTNIIVIKPSTLKLFQPNSPTSYLKIRHVTVHEVEDFFFFFSVCILLTVYLFLKKTRTQTLIFEDLFVH